MTQRLEAVDVDGRFLPPGEVVADRFELGKKIGEGPFGQVYRATDTLIDTEVAIKVFSEKLVDTPLDEEQFLKATRSARALTQKNVVRLHDSGVHSDHPWVSMQRLEGLNLRKVARLRWQRKEGFGIQELEPILSQITLALQHVGRDYPHGNLKPENIIFLPDLVKITDSYLLAAIPDDKFAEANAECFCIAPELLQEKTTEPDVRCDVFSVGAIIGYMLFGSEYEPGSEADAPGALSAVDTLCQRAMASVPDERYRSVEALNEDFTSVVDTGALLEPSSTPAVAAEPVRSEPVESELTAGPEEPTQLTEPPEAPRAQTSEPSVTKAPEKTSKKPPELKESSSSKSTSATQTQDPSVDSSKDSDDSFDPLDVETSPGIGMPLEDDLETTEYDRDESPELGDLLQTNEVTREQLETNEVDREQLEAAKAAKAAKNAQESSSTEDVDAMGVPPSELDTDSDAVDTSSADATDGSEDPGPPQRKRPPSPTGSPPPPASPKSEKSGAVAEGTKPDDDSSSTPVGAIGAIAALVAVFVVVILFALGDDPDETPAEQPDPEEIAADIDDSDDAEPEEESERIDEEAQQEAEQLREEIRAAVAEASEIPMAALSDAIEDAEERAQEIEEERQAEQQESVGSPAAASGAAQPAECPGEMVRISVGAEYVCIDAYQHPGRGHRPETNVSWFDANRLCDQANKRLCTIQEWQTACGSGYPYGASFNADRCNTEDSDGFPRSVAETGSFPQCRSPSGAYDMSGNVHEWIEEQRVVGGAHDSGADTATCQYSSAMAAGSSRDNVGFRCCKTPQ